LQVTDFISSTWCNPYVFKFFPYFLLSLNEAGCRGRDGMVVGFTTITTKVESSNPAHGEAGCTQYNIM